MKKNHSRSFLIGPPKLAVASYACRTLFLGTFHGKAGGKDAFDGMSYMNINNGSGGNSYLPAGANVEEMVLETGGASAESSVAGFRANIIPKEGGNDFRFIGFGLFTNDTFVSDNLTDELRARGLDNMAVTAQQRQRSVDGCLRGPRS